ncbi:hypothetical protein MPER_04742, partial [Moniliophthora perniciosa FA553]
MGVVDDGMDDNSDIDGDGGIQSDDGKASRKSNAKPKPKEKEKEKEKEKSKAKGKGKERGEEKEPERPKPKRLRTSAYAETSDRSTRDSYTPTIPPTTSNSSNDDSASSNQSHPGSEIPDTEVGAR